MEFDTGNEEAGVVRSAPLEEEKGKKCTGCDGVVTQSIVPLTDLAGRFSENETEELLAEMEAMREMGLGEDEVPPLRRSSTHVDLQDNTVPEAMPIWIYMPVDVMDINQVKIQAEAVGGKKKLWGNVSPNTQYTMRRATIVAKVAFVHKHDDERADIFLTDESTDETVKAALFTNTMLDAVIYDKLVKTFGPVFIPRIGDVVRIYGKVRANRSERYLSVDSIRPIPSPKAIALQMRIHSKEILLARDYWKRNGRVVWYPTGPRLKPIQLVSAKTVEGASGEADVSQDAPVRAPQDAVAAATHNSDADDDDDTTGPHDSALVDSFTPPVLSFKPHTIM